MSSKAFWETPSVLQVPAVSEFVLRNWRSTAFFIQSTALSPVHAAILTARHVHSGVQLLFAQDLSTKHLLGSALSNYHFNLFS